MKINSIIIQNVKAILLGILVVLGAGYAFAGYTAPGCVPTGCNTDAPINISDTAQAKTGRLIIGTFDTSSLSQYIFSVKSALAYIQSLATNNLTLIDDTQADGLVLTAADDTGLATWGALSTSTPPTKMYVDDFRLYVKRSAGTVNVNIPSAYQYCAISQMGPDFANSDKPQTECSVNRNNDKTWTLKGQRGDDPGFWCNVRCFSIETKPIIVIPTTVPVTAKQYYCLYKDIFTSSNMNSYIGTYYGCNVIPSFDPQYDTTTNAYFTPPPPFPNSGPGPHRAALDAFYLSNRDSFANSICGAGMWTPQTGYVTVVNGSLFVKYYTNPPSTGFTVPGFKCN